MKRLMASRGMYLTLSTPPDPWTSLFSKSSEMLRHRSQPGDAEKIQRAQSFRRFQNQLLSTTHLNSRTLY